MGRETVWEGVAFLFTLRWSPNRLFRLGYEGGGGEERLCLGAGEREDGRGGREGGLPLIMRGGAGCFREGDVTAPFKKRRHFFFFCVFSPGLEGSRWRRLAREGFIGRRHSLRRSRMLSLSRRVRGQALALSRGAGGWSRTKAVALSDAGGARRGSEEKIAQRAAASRETYRGSNKHGYPTTLDSLRACA